jgi:hypothetical protein
MFTVFRRWPLLTTAWVGLVMVATLSFQSPLMVSAETVETVPPVTEEVDTTVLEENQNLSFIENEEVVEEKELPSCPSGYDTIVTEYTGGLSWTSTGYYDSVILIGGPTDDSNQDGAYWFTVNTPTVPYEVLSRTHHPIEVVCGKPTPALTGPVTVIAHKIVCENESDLPDWAIGAPLITNTTASDWVAAHESCRLASGWNFEWAPNGGEFNPGDDHVGAAGTPWTTFGPTDTAGQATVTLSVSDLKSLPKVWVREVLAADYLSFSHESDPSNNADVSAEIYCHDGGYNYDNYEWIKGLTGGQTYHCVAWNVPTTETEEPTDLCVNLPEVQTVVPAGYTRSESGVCTVPVSCTADSAWADSVVSSDQANRLDGSPITDANRTNPAAALGAADWVNGGDTGFFSLGFGGELILRFAQPVLDQVGDDLVFYEATNGTYPLEVAEVAVSADGVNFVYVGKINNLSADRTSQLDISASGLTQIEYVRITDISDPADFTGSYGSDQPDGYDVDAVRALAADCPDEETEVPITICKFNENESPLPGWGMTVTTDGGEPTISLTTGDDGCVTTFVDPAVGPWYVFEDEPDRWEQVGVFAVGGIVRDEPEGYDYCAFFTDDEVPVIDESDVEASTAVVSELSSEEEVVDDEVIYGCGFINREVVDTDNGQSCSVTVVSDTTNTVKEKVGGAALVVTNQPEVWLDGIMSSPATWIWGSPSDSTVSGTSNETQTFVKTFSWSGPVTSAILEIASDNQYQVTLNGTVFGGDSNADNFTALDTHDLTSLMIAGVNTLEIAVTNLANESETLAGNPAGLIYRLVVTGPQANCGETITTPPTPIGGGSGRSRSSGGTRTRTPAPIVAGASTSALPAGEVLGESVSLMPVGAPNTGFGGAAPQSSLPLGLLFVIMVAGFALAVRLRHA